MALHQPSRAWLIKILPWAALPALLLALLGNEGLLLSLPYGLAGALLGLDDLRRPSATVILPAMQINAKGLIKV